MKHEKPHNGDGTDAVDAAHPRLFSSEEWERIVSALGLSPQQQRIAAMILENHCDKQIAQRLKIAVPTVRTYIGRIFAQLGISDRGELMLRVFQEFRGQSANGNHSAVKSNGDWANGRR